MGALAVDVREVDPENKVGALGDTGQALSCQRAVMEVTWEYPIALMKTHRWQRLDSLPPGGHFQSARNVRETARA